MKKTELSAHEGGRKVQRCAAVLAILSMLVLLVPLAPDAQAQGVRHIDAHIVAQADGVIDGTIQSITGIELDGLPYTIQDIEVTATVVGDFEGTIRLQIPGGQRADGSAVSVSTSAPILDVGANVQVAVSPANLELDSAIKFATGDVAQAYSVVGGDMGLVALSPEGTTIERASGNYSFLGHFYNGFDPARVFRLNPANSGVGRAQTINAVRNGFFQWENDRTSNIDFSYGGTSTVVGRNPGNDVIDVSWEFPTLGNGFKRDTLAVAFTTRDNDGNIESDIVLNRLAFWTVGPQGRGYDLETVIAHEVGHALGLAHVVSSEELMFPFFNTSEIKPLGEGEVAGVRRLYPAPATSDVAEPGHSVASNPDGDIAIIALKDDGRLLVRRDLGSGFGSWVNLGNPDWVSADVTITPQGHVYLAGFKLDGRLYTRRWDANGSWGSWTLHGNDWFTFSIPSITSNSSKVVLSAISFFGELRTIERTNRWGSVTTHGRRGWVNTDVSIAADGDIWFVGAKLDGRVFTRSKIAGRWTDFVSQGAATWLWTTTPSIAAYSNGVVFGAVKADGRLYTRHQINGRWQGFTQQGRGDWGSVDVAIGENGAAWLAAEKNFSRLYTRNASASGNWGAWTTHGFDTWSVPAEPAITIGAGQPIIIAVKESGALYHRVRSRSGWGGWVKNGRGADWAIGY